jgi:glycosyltransferase involved in cell wall biosynthesis
MMQAQEMAGQCDRPERPLRVVLVTGAYNHIRDGVALTLNRLVNYLERQGVEVLVFAPVGPRAALNHHGTLVPVASVPAPGRPEYRIALGLPPAARKRIAEFKPDLFHIAVPDILGFQALRYARRRGIPVVASYHTRYEIYLQHYGLDLLRPALTRYLDWFYGRCRHLYVPSTSMVELLASKGLGCDLRLWGRGVDTALFNPQKRSPAWRRAKGWGDDEIVVTYVGRLVREKRIDTLTQMYHLLRSRGLAIRSMLVGEGPERNAVEAALPGVLITGFLAGEELSAAYASSDIFVFPSDSETFGNVTLEAMASGLPTICADATGSRSLVAEGESGFLVDPNRGDLFADKVASLIGDPVLRVSMGAAARRLSLGFNWDAAMARILVDYNQVAR